MRKLPVLFSLLMLVNACGPSTSSSSALDQLQADKKIESSYHVYPSSLRMLNLQDEPSINKLVKDVRKLTIRSMRPDRFQQSDFYQLSNDLQNEEDYELYLELDDQDANVIVLGKEKADETIILLEGMDQSLVIDAIGTVNFLQIPKIMEYFSSRDSTTSDGFSIIEGLIGQDQRRAKRRRDRRRNREAAKNKEKAKTDSLAKINIAIDSIQQ